MWFAIGFILACGICSYGLTTAWVLPAGLGIIAAGIAVICSIKWKPVLKISMAVLTGLAIGLSWFAVFYYGYIHPVAKLDDRECYLTITASDYSRETKYGSEVEGIADIGGKSYQIRISFHEKRMLKPGDRVEGIFHVRLTVADEQNTSSYYQGKGIFLCAFQREEVAVFPCEIIPGWCFPAVLRHRILEILQEVFPEDTAPFAKALLLGESRALDYEVDTAFKISGIRHIVAVSGLHISILYSLVCIVTMRRRFLTAAVGIPVLLLFAAVAGFTPSVIRACIMACLMMLAMVFDREYDPATALAFAVLTMLMVNPLSVTSVSLQLSAGCVAGITLFHDPIHRWIKNLLPKKKNAMAKIREMLCSSISVTLSSMSLVTPLSAVYFETVSLVSILTNLLALWVVNFLFIGVALTCVLYVLSPVAAGFMAGVLAWPIRYVLLLSKTLASIPMAAVYTKSIYVILWLAFVYCLLAVFLLMKKKQPKLLLCCGILGLCIAMLAGWMEPLTSNCRITMLDVGQGQSILLQSRGKTFLVDCGGDDDTKTADMIAETVLSQGIRKLDGIILTHYDYDHSGALSHILTRLEADVLFLPDTVNEMEEIPFSGETVYVWEDLELTFANTRLQIFGPIYSGMDNENSLCVLFDTEKCDILITGDRSGFGERMLMRETPLQDVDILVAGHHGAADSTTEELLKAVKPEIVLISVAQDNSYNHPSPALLQRLNDFGCSMYRTDRDGTITIRR